VCVSDVSTWALFMMLRFFFFLVVLGMCCGLGAGLLAFAGGPGCPASPILVAFSGSVRFLVGSCVSGGIRGGLPGWVLLLLVVRRCLCVVRLLFFGFVILVVRPGFLFWAAMLDLALIARALWHFSAIVVGICGASSLAGVVDTGMRHLPNWFGWVSCVRYGRSSCLVSRFPSGHLPKLRLLLRGPRVGLSDWPRVGLSAGPRALGTSRAVRICPALLDCGGACGV
jgi:hypothetical protein